VADAIVEAPVEAASDPYFDAVMDVAAEPAAPAEPVEEPVIEAPPADDFDQALSAADQIESSVDDMFDMEG
jgi:hypothetical protein